jgi:hypothetical protein
MRGVIQVAGAVAALILAGLAGLHVYWALGGVRGAAAAIPTVDGRPLLSPSPAATLVVAALLAVSAGLLVGGVAEWSPRVVFRVGCGGVGLVLLVRAIGDRRSVGLLKRSGAPRSPVSTPGCTRRCASDSGWWRRS